MRNKSAFYAKKSIQIILCIAVLIHFTIKDKFYLSSLIFYAFPLPILIVGFSFLILLIQKKLRKYYALGILLLACIWIQRSYVITKAETISDAYEIVLWNAYRTQNFENAFQVNGNIPDVMVLIECDEHDYQKIKSKYKNYHFEFTDTAIGIFSKTPIKILKNDISERKTSVLNFRTNHFNFYAVDVAANVKYFRKTMLENVFSKIEDDQKTIILGDFNTPFESIYFKNIKKNYQHAFMEKGNGFRETWFWNIPLLSLDHIWVSKDLKIQKTEKISTYKSDHSMLKMYVKK